MINLEDHPPVPKRPKDPKPMNQQMNNKSKHIRQAS